MNVTDAIFDPELGCTGFTVERITCTRSREGTVSRSVKGQAAGCIHPGTAESPLVVEGNGWVAALGDAGVIDYARIRFASGDKPGEIKTVLEGPATVTLPYVTPWRYAHCAKDCVALANEQPRFMDALAHRRHVLDQAGEGPSRREAERGVWKSLRGLRTPQRHFVHRTGLRMVRS